MLSTISGRLSTRSVKRLSTTSGNKQITVNRNQEKTEVRGKYARNNVGERHSHTGGELGEQFYKHIADVMPNKKERYGPANHVGIYAYRLKAANDYLEKAKAGDSETVTTKTDFLQSSD